MDDIKYLNGIQKMSEWLSNSAIILNEVYSELKTLEANNVGDTHPDEIASIKNKIQDLLEKREFALKIVKNNSKN
jgi:hypothetical protein